MADIHPRKFRVHCAGFVQTVREPIAVIVAETDSPSRKPGAKVRYVFMSYEQRQGVQSTLDEVFPGRHARRIGGPLTLRDPYEGPPLLSVSALDASTGRSVDDGDPLACVERDWLSMFGTWVNVDAFVGVFWFAMHEYKAHFVKLVADSPVAMVAFRMMGIASGRYTVSKDGTDVSSLLPRST